MGISWHLEKRYKTSWTIVIDLGRDPATGKQKRITRSVKGNKEQAKQEAIRLAAEIQTGIYTEPTNITLGLYLRDWLDTSRSRLAAKTVEGYATCINKHIHPALGQIRLTDLQPMHLQTLYATLLEAGLSKRSVELVHAVLRASLKDALRMQIVQRSVADAVKPPRPERSRMTALTPQELNELLEAAAASPIADIIVLAAYTGMRRGEILALQWSDVDMGQEVIYVQRNLVRTGGKTIVKSPKTKRSNRPIPLEPEALEMLAKRRKTGVDGWVFARADGRPLDPSWVTHRFRAVAQAAGFPNLRFHDLRHTFASILLARGVQPPVVQELLGHESITTTINTYTHVIPSLKREASHTMTDALTNARSQNERRFSDGRHLRAVK